jgi:hypothetical protein
MAHCPQGIRGRGGRLENEVMMIDEEEDSRLPPESKDSVRGAQPSPLDICLAALVSSQHICFELSLCRLSLLC